MSKKPTLLLFPNVLGDVLHHDMFLPESVGRAVKGIDGLIAESEKGGRRFLSRFNLEVPVHTIPLALFNEHTPDEDIDFFLEPIKKDGERWGFVSDGGLPCIADPGAKIVRRARQVGIQVQAFSGPCSITHALVLSGLNGQRFSFHGYLPKRPEERAVEIQRLEKRAFQEDETQIFIEAPYRNMKALETLLETLCDNTLLCIAWDLTLPGQGVHTHSVGTWKKSPLPNLEKRCATFLMGAP
jgi:16S rRNA (cytidine1402-2'-O)-methyltransferase